MIEVIIGTFEQHRTSKDILNLDIPEELVGLEKDSDHKMSRLTLLACLVLLAVLIQSSQAEKWKCGKDGAKEVDELVSLILTLGRDDRKFPVNTAELKTYCK